MGEVLAQSQHHVNGLTGGWTDTDLTELGRRQAACLASRLKQKLADTPCQMVCSDLKRALRTAEVIGQEINVTPQLAPALHELNNGIAAGLWNCRELQRLNDTAHLYAAGLVEGLF